MTVNQDQNQGNQPRNDSKHQSKDTKFAFHIVIATWIIAASGIILGWIQTCSNQQAAQADLRAYLQVVNPRDDAYNNEPLLWISVVNFGKTPADDVDAGPIFSLWKRDSLPCDPDTIGRNAARGFTIAPGETLYVPLRPNLGYWRIDSTSARQAFGIVHYRDHRGESHKTVFAYQWENISRSFRKMKRFNYGD